MVYRLFISHSSGTDTLERLHDLVAEIELASQGQVKVIYDKNQIVSGDDWRRRIALMLHVCHGAVVLLDAAALLSPWVLAESTFLSLRRSYDAKFSFIPVSFLDSADLDRQRALAATQQSLTQGSWAVVKLEAIQFVRAHTTKQVAVSIMDALHQRGLDASCPTPAGALAAQLAKLLDQASESALQDLADQLIGRAGYLTGDPRTLAALAIVEAVLSTQSLKAIRDRLDNFGSAFPDQQLYRILDQLVPLVMPAETSALLMRRRRNGGFAHASLSANRPRETVPRYIRRAHLPRRPPVHFEIANTLGSFEDLRCGLRTAWRNKHPDQRAFTDADIDDQLSSDDLDLYAWIPGPIDQGVIEQLEQHYPRVAIIVHHLASDPPTAAPLQLLPIAPPLTPEEERRIIMDYGLATVGLALDGYPA